MRPWIPRAALAAICIVAVGRAATASSSPRVEPIGSTLAHRAYSEIVSSEASMRREAALKFPGDPWSADDDFHQRESDSVRSFAGHQNVPIGGVLAAIDDGMHDHWRATGTPTATVPPCRPRLMY